MANSWKIQSAVKMHERFPDTYEIPDRETVRKLTPGTNVKVTFRAKGYLPERMWCLIRSKIPNGYEVSVNNKSFQSVYPPLDSVLRIRFDQIQDILTND